MNQLLTLPVRERLEAIEQLVSLVKEESAPTPDPEHKRPDLDRYFGIAKEVYGDGLAYQKRLRDEWD